MSGLDISILRKFYPISILISVLTCSVVVFTHGQATCWSLLTGLAFGLLNLYFIQILTISTIHPEKRNPILASLVLTVKFPILYGILIFVFAAGLVDPVVFTIGFVLFLLSLLVYLSVLAIPYMRHRISDGSDAG